MSYSKYGKDLATFTRRLREDFDLQQKDLAKMMKCHPQYVSNVERGVHEQPVTFGVKLLSIPIIDTRRREHLVELITEATFDRSIKFNMPTKKVAVEKQR